MKVLQVSCSAYPFHNSGVATVVKNISKELKKIGHDVYLFTLSFSKEYENLSLINIDTEDYKARCIVLHDSIDNFFNTFKESNYNNSLIESQFQKYLDDIKIDIVHFHSMQGLGANLIKIAKLKGLKTIVTMHDWWWICPNSFMADCYHNPCDQIRVERYKCIECISKINQLESTKLYLSGFCASDFLEKRYKFLSDIIENYTDCLLVVSSYLKQYVEQNGLKTKSLMVNVNGVEEPISRRQENKGKSDKIIFGFLGGSSDLKGYDILIDTFNNIEDDGWELRIYGIGEKSVSKIKKGLLYLKNGKIKALIRKFLNNVCKLKDCKSNIKLYPRFEPEEKDDILCNIDVLIAISKVKESSSLVVREALIRNIPVIISKSGGAEEVVEHNNNGIILSQNNTEKLTECIKKMLKSNILDTLKKNCRNNSYKYTYKDQVRILNDIYDEL